MARIAQSRGKQPGGKRPIGKTPHTLQAITGGGKPVNMHAATKKKKRFKAGTVALREIRKAQLCTDPLMQKAPFKRLVRQTAHEVKDFCGIGNNSIHFAGAVFPILQEAFEHHQIKEIEDAYLISIHAKRVTLQPKDIQLARHVKKN
jgi:histone H3